MRPSLRPEKRLASGLPAHHGALQVNRAENRHRQHHQRWHRVERLGEPERCLGDRRQCSRQADALRAARDEGDAAQDPHRAERDDEWMDAEADHHQSVDHATEEADADGNAEAEHRRRQCRLGRVRPQHHRRGHAGQRVNRPDGEVDAAGDDHDGGADGHDGEEARIGGCLDQGVRVQEIVDALAGDAIGVRPGEEGEERAQADDDEKETGLCGAEESSDHRLGDR
jgi:hypothetical protein